jgi:monofunctional biosynthetic peptidoglycan transglycosylase
MAKKTTKTPKGSEAQKRNSAKAKKENKSLDANGKRVFRRTFKGFLFRFAFAFSMLIVLVPALFLFIYRFEFVHPVSTLMVKEALVGHGAKREWIDIEDMAPVLYQSVLSSEDGQFCAHSGVDWGALNQVIEDAIDGERTRGASTITMQLVKNLFLWPNRSFIRKGLEIPYAMMAELILPKKRIMEIYLNIAEWDKGIFGVELAAQEYFGRSAAKLGPRYSSLLAVTLPNPKQRNAAKPSRSMDRVARIVQRRAKASGAYVQCLK